MIDGKKDSRKKIKADPSREYVDYICGLYGDAYDDRKEDSKPQGKDWIPGEKANHKSLEGFRKQLKRKYNIELSTAKIRKILITGECWSTERSREIQKKYSELKSIPLVAENLGLSTALVVMNLPYEKVVYDLDDKSGNAKRIKKWRNKTKMRPAMNYKITKCSVIINRIKKILDLQDVKVCFYSKKELKNRIHNQKHIIFFNVMDESEREKFQKKPDVYKNNYKAKSYAIWFPDLTVDELVQIYKCGVTDDYSRICERVTKIKMAMNTPIEIRLIMNFFLHEVEHWKQFMSVNMKVKDFIEMDFEAEKKLDNEFLEVMSHINNNLNQIPIGENPVIMEKEMNELKRIQKEYREIPKEKEADEYAQKMMESFSKKNIEQILAL